VTPGWRLRGWQLAALVLAVVLVVLVVKHHLLTLDTLFFFVSAVVSIIIHEVSHGVAALACGDDTAKRAGRLTANPLAHIDPVGTIIVPAVLTLFGLPVLAWAKPVPVNVSRLRLPPEPGGGRRAGRSVR
jgi:Zn-dependent protease